MPILPSGRRVEFSLDRFHTMLDRMGRQSARKTVQNLNDPDDLLFVLDAVHFSLIDGSPYFANYVASDWARHGADWSTADRQAMQAWLASDTARCYRAEAIDYIKALVSDTEDYSIPYPYVDPVASPLVTHAAPSLLRQ